MAPKRGVKRAAVPDAAKQLGPTLKKLHVTQSSFKQVAEALAHPSLQLSEDCREMLLAGLPHSLCIFSDERSSLQDLVVGMVEEAISRILGGLQLGLDKENEAVAGAEAKKEELDREVQAAEEALEGAKGSSSTASAELQAASEAVVKAKASAAQTAKAKKAGDAELEQGIATKELLDSALQSFEQLKVGGDAQLFKALEPALKLLPMDKSLRTTVPGVLTKTPDQRGVFDGTVVEELEKSFGLKIAEQAEAVATLRAATAEKAQQAQEAAEATEAAEEQQKKASDGVCAAKQAQKDAAQAVAKAKEAVTVYKPEFKAATKARDAKQEELQVFTDNGLATFQDLKGRISAKKRKEMKAAEAAKAEEEAAKAEAEAAAAAAEADQAAQAAAATALAEAAAEVLPQAA